MRLSTGRSPTHRRVLLVFAVVGVAALGATRPPQTRHPRPPHPRRRRPPPRPLAPRRPPRPHAAGPARPSARRGGACASSTPPRSSAPARRSSASRTVSYCPTRSAAVATRRWILRRRLAHPRAQARARRRPRGGTRRAEGLAVDERLGRAAGGAAVRAAAAAWPCVDAWTAASGSSMGMISPAQAARRHRPLSLVIAGPARRGGGGGGRRPGGANQKSRACEKLRCAPSGCRGDGGSAVAWRHSRVLWQHVASTTNPAHAPSFGGAPAGHACASCGLTHHSLAPEVWTCTVPLWKTSSVCSGRPSRFPTARSFSPKKTHSASPKRNLGFASAAGAAASRITRRSRRASSSCSTVLTTTGLADGQAASLNARQHVLGRELRRPPPATPRPPTPARPPTPLPAQKDQFAAPPPSISTSWSRWYRAAIS